MVFSTMRVYVVGVEVGSIDETAIDGFGVSSAVVFEGRFSEVGCEGAVGDPSGGLLELNGMEGTC